MSDVIIPAFNSNDESYVLIEWLVPDGAMASSGSVLALIETSKAITELVAHADGCLRHAMKAMSTCRPGDVAGYLSTSGARNDTAAGERPGIVITRPAQQLMEARGITSEEIADLGKPVVRRADIDALSSKSRGPGSTRELSANQFAVARAVMRSHASIPAAYTVIRVIADELLRRQSAEVSRYIGIPEYVIEAIARTAADFPEFLMEVDDDLRLTAAQSMDIGVTIDVGTGLYVPVIRAADTMRSDQIADEMMSLRVRALRKSLDVRHFNGARITLALHHAEGIVLAQPMIYPGQVCTLSLAGLDKRPWLDATDRPVMQSYFHLGLSYDHRIVNGSQAIAFLSSIRDQLERSPA